MPTNYRDQVVITFQQIGGFGDPRVLDAEKIVISPQGNDVDLDWISDEIESMFRGYIDGVDYPVVKDNYQLHQERTDVHWGAAGFTAQFVVDTAAQLAISGVDTAIGVAIGLFIDRLRERGYEVRHGKVKALTYAEAEMYGLQAIEAHYGVAADDLQVRSSGKNANDENTVTAKGPDGSVYDVAFVRRGTTTKTMSINRTYPDSI